MFRNLEGWHFVVLLVVILLLFGSKKLPDAARGLGRSMRIFKSEMKTLNEDDKPTTTATASTTKADPAELPPTSATDTTGRSGETTAERETPPRVDG